MDADERLLSGRNVPLDAVSVLGDSRQRRILSVLRDRARPMTVRDLAVALAAAEAGTAPSAVTEDDRRSIRIDLHHRCLPKLEALGWIDRYPEGVVAADPPSLAVPGASPLERDDAASPASGAVDERPTTEAIDALLARPRRRELASVLADRGRLSLAELATELVERDRDSWGREREEDQTAVRCTLHHVDLPRMAEAGLIEYDHEARTVTPTENLQALLNGTSLGD